MKLSLLKRKKIKKKFLIYLIMEISARYSTIKSFKFTNKGLGKTKTIILILMITKLELSKVYNNKEKNISLDK